MIIKVYWELLRAYSEKTIVNLLPETSKCLIFLKLPTSEGISPESWFLPKLRRMVKKESPTTNLGMIPWRLFWERSKSCKFCKFPKAEGMFPLTWFFSRWSEYNWFVLAMKDGMRPESEFLDKSKRRSILRLLIAFRMLYVKLWFAIVNSVKLTRFHILVGIRPYKLFPPNLNCLSWVERMPRE